MPIRTGTIRLPDPRRPSILHIHVELGGRVYEEDLEAQARVDTDPEGLNRALAEQPGRFAWWATLEVLAQSLAEATERELDRKHAELYVFYEAKLIVTDEKGKRTRPTVDRVKSEILRHPEYRAIQERLAVAQEQHRELIAARQTMRDRRDVLLAVASNMRSEREAHTFDQVRAVRDRLAAGRG